jgi:hypothetical protein
MACPICAYVLFPDAASASWLKGSRQCFAWSPDQAFDDLVAVGMANGKVDLFRMEGNSTAGKNGVLTRAAAVTIGGKSSRACNVLAFSAVTPSLLASGLDKIRGDQR